MQMLKYISEGFKIDLIWKTLLFLLLNLFQLIINTNIKFSWCLTKFHNFFAKN